MLPSLHRNRDQTLTKTVQFNWSRHWPRRVEPHLQKPLFQAALNFGMKLYDPDWQTGDPPYLLGAIPLRRTRVVPGKLSWYRAWCRCHWLSFFSMAVGVLNFPDLDWRFVIGDLHTVPVGYGPDGEPRVVMDILLFDQMTAEGSLANTQRRSDRVPSARGWNRVFKFFTERFVPALRASVEDQRKLRAPKE